MPGLTLEKDGKIERPVLAEELRHQLGEELQDYMNRLREYTGDEFADWCV